MRVGGGFIAASNEDQQAEERLVEAFRVWFILTRELEYYLKTERFRTQTQRIVFKIIKPSGDIPGTPLSTKIGRKQGEFPGGPIWRQSGIEPKNHEIPFRNTEIPKFFARLRRDLVKIPFRNRQKLKFSAAEGGENFGFLDKIPYRNLQFRKFFWPPKAAENFGDFGYLKI